MEDEKNETKKDETKKNETKVRKVGIPLGLGVFFIPYVFSWFTLRKGHSNFAKGVSFSWLFVCLLAGVTSTDNTSRKTASATPLKSESEKVLSFVTNSCLELSQKFGASSNLSDIQKKELWKSFYGKAFKWSLEVTEVSEAMLGNGYQVQFKCNKSHAFVSDIIIDYPKSSKQLVMQFQKGSLYKVQGRLEDYNSLIGLTAAVIQDH